MQNKLLDKILSEGIRFLVEQQLPNGNIISYSSTRQNDFLNATQYQTTFQIALILNALHSLSNDALKDRFVNKALHYLLHQKSDYWTFNYWDRRSDSAKNNPYPDDLDDTYVALRALYAYKPEIFTGDVLAKIVTALTLVEAAEGGPYKTWFVDSHQTSVWHDIDIAVNANIGHFLHTLDTEAEGLTQYISENIRLQSFSSPYYPSALPALYYLSFLTTKPEKNILLRTLKKMSRNKYVVNNPLNLALVISSMLKLGQDSSSVMHLVSLLCKMPPSIIHQSYAFCIDPSIEKVTYFAGSPSLTTAFVIEAISLYKQHIREEALQKARSKDVQEAASFHSSIVSKVQNTVQLLPLAVRAEATNHVQTTLSTDQNKQISLLPYYFAKAMHLQIHSLLRSLLISLGVVNTYGWLAYRIYDDIIDGDKSPVELSIGNVFTRYLLADYLRVIPDNNFRQLYFRVMNTLDAANYWESRYCHFNPNTEINFQTFKLPKYNNYEILAQKSFGHALPVLALLYTSFIKSTLKDHQNIETYFTHYLIARQLHDDAHDWDADLEKGFINPVGALVLKQWRKINPNPKYESKNVSQLLPELRSIYWHNTITIVAKLIRLHLTKADTAITKCTLIKNPVDILLMTQKLRISLENVEKEQAQAITFLKEYESL